jgi:pyoverdine/dityrosine biosynthesis protein Dit1
MKSRDPMNMDPVYVEFWNALRAMVQDIQSKCCEELRRIASCEVDSKGKSKRVEEYESQLIKSCHSLVSRLDENILIKVGNLKELFEYATKFFEEITIVVKDVHYESISKIREILKSYCLKTQSLLESTKRASACIGTKTE